MKKTLCFCLSFAAVGAFGQLSSADPARLAEYQTWFGDFKIASDSTEAGLPSPVNELPASSSNWSGWKPNWGGTGFTAPIENTDPKLKLVVEYVFLGETAGWWDDWGMIVDGEKSLIADGVQAAGATPNRKFGDNGVIKLDPGSKIDFFVTGSGISFQDDQITIGTSGGLYRAFQPGLSEPTSASMQSYYGVLTPTSTEPVTEDTPPVVPFLVFGFEDIRLGNTDSWQDRDYNDFLFAVRATQEDEQGPVPEPSTYGLAAVMLLLFLAEYRRRRS